MILKASFFITIILLLSACDKDRFSHIVEIELPEHTPKLTAICTVTNILSARDVFVSHSKTLLDTSAYELIDDAIVKLYKDGNFLTEYSWFEDSDRYFSPFFSTDFESGDFEMEISAPGFETIRATQTLPINAEILDAKYKVDGVVDIYGNVKDLLEIEILDDGNQDNFYSIGVSANGTIANGNSFREVYGHSDDLFMKKGWKEEFFPDENFNGGKYILRYIIDVDLEDHFELNNGGSLTEFNINVLSYSRDYYDYSTSIKQYHDNQYLPFTEPVIVSTNWENGYGIFSVVNLEKFKLEL